MQFKLVAGISRDIEVAVQTLEMRVNEAIKNGYIPVGVPFTVSQHFHSGVSQVGIMQALVLPDMVEDAPAWQNKESRPRNSGPILN